MAPNDLVIILFRIFFEKLSPTLLYLLKIFDANVAKYQTIGYYYCRCAFSVQLNSCVSVDGFHALNFECQYKF